MPAGAHGAGRTPIWVFAPVAAAIFQTGQGLPAAARSATNRMDLLSPVRPSMPVVLVKTVVRVASRTTGTLPEPEPVAV